MTEYYGSAFVSQYGDEPNATWAYMLRELSIDDYRRGLELLVNREGAFPPNPGEFLTMIGNDNAWERQAHRVFETENLLEDKTGKERRAAEGLANLRALREQVGL